MITVTETKMQVLMDRKLPAGASPTDAVVIAAEKSRSAPEMFAGILTDTGERP